MEERSLLTLVQDAEAVKLCQELVRIKSVNPPRDELPIAEYVASMLKKVGGVVELVRHSPTRASVLASTSLQK